MSPMIEHNGGGCGVVGGSVAPGTVVDAGTMIGGRGEMVCLWAWA
jgi:hypothetical protein